jgi:hypothetical protein
MKENPAYVSNVRIERLKGPLRRAHLPPPGSTCL